MSVLDVADEMEYDERLALFRQTRLNPFDRGEEEDVPQNGKMPPHHGNVLTEYYLTFMLILTNGLIEQFFVVIIHSHHNNESRGRFSTIVNSGDADPNSHSTSPHLVDLLTISGFYKDLSKTSLIVRTTTVYFSVSGKNTHMISVISVPY